MNFEHIFGVKLAALVAGLAGGLVALTYEHNLSPLKAITLIFTGGITAGYSFTALEHYYSLHTSTTGIAAFGLGLVSMRIIDVIMIVADMIRKDPALLLSLPKLYKQIKDGSNTSDYSVKRDDSISVDPAGTSSEEHRLPGE